MGYVVEGAVIGLITIKGSGHERWRTYAIGLLVGAFIFEGYTLNTLDVTYVDGTSERQTRKLVFSEDELIEADTL